MAYVNIASTTVGSGGASTVTFSSIPQIYRDLEVIINGRSNVSGYVDTMTCQFNGSGSMTLNIAYALHNNNNSNSISTGTVSSTNNVGWSIGNTGHNSNIFGFTKLYFTNYSNTNIPTHLWSKTQDCTNLAQSSNNIYIGNVTGYTSANTAITQLTLGFASSSWMQYTDISLYGIG